MLSASRTQPFSIRCFSANRTNPPFTTLLNNPNIRAARLFQKLTMLLHTKQLQPSPRGVLLRKLSSLRRRSSIDLGNQDERAPRLQNSKHLTHITRQIRPPKVGLHSRNQIEHPVRKRQLRHRTLPNLHAAGIDTSCIDSLRCSNALLGV